MIKTMTMTAIRLKYHQMIYVKTINVTSEGSYVLEVAIAELEQTDGTGGPTSRVVLMSTGDLCS